MLLDHEGHEGHELGHARTQGRTWLCSSAAWRLFLSGPFTDRQRRQSREAAKGEGRLPFSSDLGGSAIDRGIDRVIV